MATPVGDGHRRARAGRVADGRVVLDASDGVPAGWFRLQVSRAGMSAADDLVLLVEHGRGEADLTEYELPFLDSDPADYLIEVDRPVFRMTLDGSGRSESGVQAKVRRLGLVSRAVRALRQSPQEALSAFGWRLVGKKVRARNRLNKALGLVPAMNYGRWLGSRTPIWDAEIGNLCDELKAWAQRPSITVVIDLGKTQEVSRRTLASLASQPSPFLQVILVGNKTLRSSSLTGTSGKWKWSGVRGHKAGRRADRLNAALTIATGDWLFPIRNGDLLADGALVRLAAAARDHPEALAIYGDHDAISLRGHRRSPAFKPDWNEPYFLAHDYIGWCVAFSRHAVVQQGGFARDAEDHEIGDMLLRLAGVPSEGDRDRIHHVPKLLLHIPVGSDGGTQSAVSTAARARTVERRLLARGEPARAIADRPGIVRVMWPLPANLPLVSLIVPTRDRVDLLRPCVEGLRNGTDYPALEIIIADNGSQQTETKAYLRSLGGDARIRVLPVGGPFNFSGINNTAVRASRGDILGFVNNDIEVMDAGWLKEMVRYAVRPGIGAVGAKLLYESGLVQHAGVVMGLGGLAGHVHRFRMADQRGYQFRLLAPQHFAAVTAACLVVRRERFLAVGGFDEDAFPIAFNDVDLCLKLTRKGWRSLWTPFATLRHKETASRARDMSRARLDAWSLECEQLRARWDTYIQHDPHYNENLTREREDFLL